MLIPSKFSGYRPDGVRLYPGDGPDVPPPDPRLVEAQITSLGVQNDAIQRIVAQAEALAPLQREQMEQAIAAQGLAMDQAVEDRAYTIDRRDELTTLQDRMISDANSFNAEARGEQLADQSMADVTGQFSNSRDQMVRSMQRSGVNPASGGYMDIIAKSGLAEAAAKAGAANRSREAARQEGYALTDRAANSLAGYPALSMGTNDMISKYGLTGLDAANAGTQGLISPNASVVSGAGAMGGNATSAYNSQMDAYLQGNDNSGIWGAVGTLGGAAITAF